MRYLRRNKQLTVRGVNKVGVGMAEGRRKEKGEGRHERKSEKGKTKRIKEKPGPEC